MTEELELIKATQEKMRKLWMNDVEVRNKKITFNLPEGSFDGEIIFENDMVNISQVVVPAGTYFDFHTHEATEVFIVQGGRMAVDMGNKSLVVRKHGTFTVPYKAKHAVTYLEETDVIFITIPKEKRYSHGKKQSDKRG